MFDLPTGTVTLLFTDIEGSTSLLQQLGERYADVLSECRQLLRAVFHQWNGHEVDTQGDSFFVVLPAQLMPFQLQWLCNVQLLLVPGQMK